MKMYDFGIVTALVLIALAAGSAFLHKHKEDCPIVCGTLEDVAESEMDLIMNLPIGTSHYIIDKAERSNYFPVK